MPDEQDTGVTWEDICAIVENNAVRRGYLYGPPGVGKSHLAVHGLEKRFPGKTFQCTVNEDVSVQELLGHYIPKGGDFVWHDGPVSLAMRGGALIVNELPRASGAVRDLMLAVLDEVDVCSIALPTGELLKPHEKFVVIATGNDKPEDCLCDALIDRFNTIVHLPFPNPKLVEYIDSLMPKAGELVRRSYHSTTRIVSPRKMISFIEFLTAGQPEHKAAGLAFGVEAGAEVLRALHILSGKVV